MIKLTKETDDGYAWSDFFNQVIEQDPGEFEETKLLFIGTCEHILGITADLLPHLMNLHPCKVRKWLIKKIFFR